MALRTRRIIVAVLAAGGAAIAGYGVPATFGSTPATNGTVVLADDDDDGGFYCFYDDDCWGDDDD